jgi:protein-tyrosine phosphatase
MFINKLFQQKKLTNPLDLSPLGTDMHSHLLPGLDDGSATTEESLELIRQLQGLGFRKLITTPHVQSEFFRNTPETILDGLEKMKRLLAAENVPVELEAAAEYLLDEGFEEQLKRGGLLSFGDRYVLVELSYYNPHPDLNNFIFLLQVEGYKVILAHPERYSYWFNDFSRYEELKDRGVFFQLNAISLAGYYPAPIKDIAGKLVDKEMIEFLGTDVHNQRYVDALEHARYERLLAKLIDSGKLLNGRL